MARTLATVATRLKIAPEPSKPPRRGSLAYAFECDWNFLARAVREYGGIKKAARLLLMTQAELKKCLRKGQIDEWRAIKIGKRVKMYWPFIAYGAR